MNGLIFSQQLGDPTTSDHLVSLIEDGGLAGGDCTLGIVEDGVDEVVACAAEGGHGRRMTMADLDGDADGFVLSEVRDGDPVEAIGVEVAREEVFICAYGDLVRVRVDVEDVERIDAREAEPLALAYGEALDAFVAADDLGVGRLASIAPSFEGL